MLQSFEPPPPPARPHFRTASPVPPPKPPLKLPPAWRAHAAHIRRCSGTHFNGNWITAANSNVSSRVSEHRVPSPMPPSLPRMSAEDGTSSPSKRTVDNDSQPSSVGRAMAQQAQEYLEQNIRYLMRPRGTTAVLSQPSSGAPGGMVPGTARGGSIVPFDTGLPPFAPMPANSTPCTPLMSTSPSSCPLAASTSFPHSLDAAGHSSSGVLQGTSYSSPCGSAALVGRSPSAAASFFARAAQRLNLSSKKKRRHSSSAGMGNTSESDSHLVTHFSDMIRDSPPSAPPTLLRGIGRKDTGLGKVKVMLRVCPTSASASSAPGDGRNFLSLDARKKQVTLYDPTASIGSSSPETHNATAARLGVAAPKMFAFDAIFSQDDTQTEVCSTSLTDIIQAVVNGSDGCLFVYGHAHLGKTWTMLGGSGSSQELGVIPCAISWLFRLINEHKQKTGARFSIRASAVHISGRSETLIDLLADHASGTEGSSPGVYLRDDPVFGTKLMNYSELRAPTAERAAFLLDAAVTAASANQCTEEDRRNSHFLFTLHVYQYRVDKSGRGGGEFRHFLTLLVFNSCEFQPVAGGRSRLHLFDLGSCEKTSKGPLTLSALGNVILALFNAQKRVPHKDSKVTQLLKEALGSITCRAAMIAHVSPSPAHYAETLATIQLASRVHRIRRKKIKYASTASGGDACDGAVCRPFMRTQAVNEDGGAKSGSSDPEYTSSSEQSCDTVIYVGRHQEMTDNEGPPCIPSLSPTPQNSPARSATATKTQEPPAKNSSSALTTTTRTPSPDVKVKAGPGGTVAKTTLPRNSTAGRSPHHQPSSSPDCQQRTHSLKKNQHKSPAKDVVAEGVKKKSDEVWVDGPRFSKPRFDTRTLHQLQKEQWVDGPAANAVYGYMDDHKKTMIERWVEEHSRHFQGGKSKKAKNKLSKGHGKEVHDGGGSSARSTPEHRKTRTHRETELKQGVSPDKAKRPEESKADAVSSTAEKDSEDGEDHKAEGAVEDDSVQMQDLCLQVTEEDILAATCSWTGSNENPLPEVDQGSSVSNGSSSGRHPLRALSEEGLNLPSSFTESRSVSVDFEEDATNVREEFLGQVYGGLTWRLLQGTLLQRRKERQERRRKLQGDDVNAIMKGDVLTEKLERIARLRKLTSPYFDNNNERIPSLLVMRSGASSPTLRTQPYASLPNRGSKAANRQTVSEMLYGGDESSAESSDCADVTSIHSEPADLDADKYDIQRLNIKPMNGLKLEAFYNRIQKASVPLMTGSVPKLSEAQTLFQSYSEKLDMLAKDFGVFPGGDMQEIQTHVRHPFTDAGKPQVDAEMADKLQKQNSASDSQIDKAHSYCTLESKTHHDGTPAPVKSSNENCRDLECPRVENSQNVTPSPAHQPKPRLNKALNSSCRASPTHPKSEHPSPKRVASSPKPAHKASNGHTPKTHTLVAQHGGSPASSSCGALTTCCSPTRSKVSTGKTARTACSNGKHCNSEKPRKHPRNPPTNVQCNPLCRSVSTPTTPCSATDVKSDIICQVETLEPELLPSPYAKVTQARPTVRESSSGHGSSDSSSFKRTMKTIQVVQCSGTSSGYESIILRDSTAPSSSQDSGSERELKDQRGRKGSRKNGQGSGRSRSAPGRSPPQSPPVQRRQPVPGFSQHVHRWHHGQELRAHQHEDEVGCAGLLCCRLLDFY